MSHHIYDDAAVERLIIFPLNKSTVSSLARDSITWEN